MQILIVEDHADSAQYLSLVLARKGYDVQSVATAEAALKLCDDVGFDLLISDIGLPDDDGWHLLKRVRERCAVKAIALSGFAMKSDIDKSLAAGFDAHLTKPVELALLIQTVDEVLEMPNRLATSG